MLRVAADDFTSWLRGEAGFGIATDQVLAQVAERLAQHKVHALGLRSATFSVQMNERGVVAVLDNLPGDWALVHMPTGNATSDYAASETTAFHWTVAHASAREVLNRPGLDSPFLTALDWGPTPSDTAKRCDFMGDFVYLRGRAWVSFDDQPLCGGSGQRLGIEVSHILGSAPWLAHGRWSIDSCGTVTVTHLWPWCEPARLLAALDADNGLR